MNRRQLGNQPEQRTADQEYDRAGDLRLSRKSRQHGNADQES
jgi:hypothetical protein